MGGGHNGIESIEVMDANGNRKIYAKGGRALPETDGEFTRLMDCMDCHNRTGHPFLPPGPALDQKLLTGKIPAELPYIRRQAEVVIARSHQSKEEGRIAISRDIQAWYREHYPEIARDKQDLINFAVAGITEAWEENVFPAMAVGWGTYASNLNHAGCFRCHNDSFRDDLGGTIPSACDTCHIVLAEKSAPAHTYRLFNTLTSHR